MFATQTSLPWLMWFHQQWLSCYHAVQHQLHLLHGCAVQVHWKTQCTKESQQKRIPLSWTPFKRHQWHAWCVAAQSCTQMHSADSVCLHPAAAPMRAAWLDTLVRQLLASFGVQCSCRKRTAGTVAPEAACRLLFTYWL